MLSLFLQRALDCRKKDSSSSLLGPGTLQKGLRVVELGELFESNAPILHNLTQYMAIPGAGTGVVTMMLANILGQILSSIETNGLFHLTATDLC